jgi:hypothetical protein
MKTDNVFSSVFIITSVFTSEFNDKAIRAVGAIPTLIYPRYSHAVKNKRKGKNCSSGTLRGALWANLLALQFLRYV